MKINISVPFEIDIPDYIVETIRNNAIDEVLEILRRYDVPCDIEANSEIIKLKERGLNENTAD